MTFRRISKHSASKAPAELARRREIDWDRVPPTAEQAEQFGREAGEALSRGVRTAAQTFAAAGQRLARAVVKVEAEMETLEASGAITASQQAALDDYRRRKAHILADTKA